MKKAYFNIIFVLIFFMSLASVFAGSGRILKAVTIRNDLSGFSGDIVELKDIQSEETFRAVILGEGIGTVTIDGRVHTVKYGGDVKAVDGDYIKIESSPGGTLDGTYIRPQRVFRDSFVIMGSPESNDRILKVNKILNDLSGFSGDIVELIDSKSGEVFDVNIIAEGIGTISIDGESYSVRYWDDRLVEDDERIEISGTGVLGGTQRVFRDSFVVLSNPIIGKTVRVIRGDVNADGVVDISDVIYLLDYLFRNGAKPSAPFPEAAECTIG